jgi:hypothetical protein
LRWASRHKQGGKGRHDEARHEVEALQLAHDEEPTRDHDWEQGRVPRHPPGCRMIEQES